MSAIAPHPCPCCHSAPTVEPDPWCRSWSVVCCVDGDGGIVGGGTTRDEAIADWNGRVEAERLCQLHSALTDMVALCAYVPDDWLDAADTRYRVDVPAETLRRARAALKGAP